MTFRFDVIYDHLDVNNSKQPNIVINHKIFSKSEENDTSLFVKIHGIEYNLVMNERLKQNSQEITLIKLDNVMINESSFLEFDDIDQHYYTNKSVMFEIPSQEFTKLINSRVRGNEIILLLQCKIKYEVYKFQNGYYSLKNINLFDIKFVHKDKTSNRISLTDKEISSLIKDNKYKETIKINLDIENESPSNTSLKQAIEQLKLASNGFQEGDFHKVLVNSRNAIFNHLTEYDNPKSRKRMRRIKQEIKDLYLSNTPTQLTRFYKDILHEIDRITSSLGNLLSKFIHTDSDNIVQRPFLEDLELIYFSLCLLIRYLTKITNSIII